MKYIRRILQIVVTLLGANCFAVLSSIWGETGNKIWLGICLFVLFQWIFFLPVYRKGIPFSLEIMRGGYELIICTVVAAVLEIFLGIALWKPYAEAGQLFWYMINMIVAVLVLFLLMANGVIRLVFTSKQGKLLHKAGLLLLWWLPGWNLYCMASLARTVRREYYSETGRLELDAIRAESQICHTRYPIVMVHGVFFRDWQLFNYWGRIPKELMKNGAVIYYGEQQSAAAIAESAAELKKKVLSIIEETGCGKVNLIAHSKGGLDARYAISCLGLAPYVASLTTINTPHCGCLWAEQLLQKVPGSLLQFVAKRYEVLFTRLGDRKPDFISAVQELTATRCRRLNQEAKDAAGVYYQSVMSIMSRNRSDCFPLNCLHQLVQSAEGNNDGLVCELSARWGNYLGTLGTRGTRGISHGDMIDLRREDIRGFDVREFYVNLVRELKERNL